MAVQLKEIAPEYYETLAYHKSWTWVTWKFLSDPEVGPWTRMRRPTREPVTTPATPDKAAALVSLDPHLSSRRMSSAHPSFSCTHFMNELSCGLQTRKYDRASLAAADCIILTCSPFLLNLQTVLMLAASKQSRSL